MTTPDIASTWANIRQGVKDAEILIGQKKYNLSMIKSRQVLELMVNYLCSNASVAEDDLASSIDALYDCQWIDRTTCEHYHKIRMLGNKAVHDGNDDAYDANQSYHLLSQEVYTFANEYKSKQGRPSGRNASMSGGNRSQGGRGAAGRNSPSKVSAGRFPENRGSGSRSSGSRTQRSRSSSSRSRRRQSSGGLSISATDLIRAGLVIAVIVVIIILVRILNPSKPDAEQETSSSAPTESFTAPVEPPTTTAVPIETMAETTPAPVYKISADSLNVRSEPSTAGQKLGSLANGTIVDYVEDYDDEWAIINYNGQQAYVNKQFLVHD